MASTFCLGCCFRVELHHGCSSQMYSRPALTLYRVQSFGCGLSGSHPYCALRNYFRTHPRSNGSTNTDSCLNSGPQSDSLFGIFATPFGSNRLRWIFRMRHKWMVWLLMQMHDREGMHTICFREGESSTYVLRNKCVVLNQVVTECPAILHESPYFLLSPLVLTAPPLLGSTFYELENVWSFEWYCVLIFSCNAVWT